jgi:hypothetical protein
MKQAERQQRQRDRISRLLCQQRPKIPLRHLITALGEQELNAPVSIHYRLIFR